MNYLVYIAQVIVALTIIIVSYNLITENVKAK